MDSVACQFSVKQVLGAPFYNFFCILVVHPKKSYRKVNFFLMRFTNNYEKRSPFFEELNTLPLEI